MELHEAVLDIILEHPGTSRDHLLRRFDLSDYRLNRVFRHIARGLSGRALVHHSGHGVWIVDFDAERCFGMEWIGADTGGYTQCSRYPEFPDRGCYLHSQCEGTDMVAFSRTLAYLVGPSEPSARNLSQLGLTTVEDILETLKKIRPMTRKDLLNKVRYLRVVVAARAAIKRRERMRPRNSASWIPPEFWDRHTRSSINTFEFSLKKYFAVLEVPVDSDRDRVLKAWKNLCKVYHPDLGGGDEERMKAINEAKDRIFRIRRWD